MQDKELREAANCTTETMYTVAMHRCLYKGTRNQQGISARFSAKFVARGYAWHADMLEQAANL